MGGRLMGACTSNRTTPKEELTLNVQSLMIL